MRTDRGTQNGGSGGRTILVVDDDRTALESVSDILEDQDYIVQGARSGQEALDILPRLPERSMTILDYVLPDIPGTELAKLINKHSEDIINILLTGRADFDTALNAIRSGCVYDYLVKPVHPPDLLKVIKKGMEQQDLKIENRKHVQKIKQLNERMSLFLSMVNHDLRSPLTAILGYIGIMPAQEMLDGSQLKCIENVKMASERMLLLVNDLLDFSSMESGKFSLILKETELVPVVQRNVEDSKFSAAARGVRLVSVLPDKPYRVQVDERRISQVLANLVFNAIKYSPKDGEVFISIKEREDGYYEVAVKDDGPGIGKDDLEKIFERFYQTDGAKKEQGSLGLGLYITKQIIEQHGGKIWAESEGRNKGAAFRFILPKSVKRGI